MLGKAQADPPLRNMQRYPRSTGGGYRDGAVTKAELMKFWGPGVDDLRGSLIMNMRKKGFIRVNANKDEFVHLKEADIEAFIPGIISYDTQVSGYSQQKYIDWQDVPDNFQRPGFAPEARQTPNLDPSNVVHGLWSGLALGACMTGA